MLFEYDSVLRLQRNVAALTEKKLHMDAEMELFKKTAVHVNVEARHPAAFGDEALRAGLYIPGHRFRIEKFHPGAVARTPLPDGAKVVTPFGNGRVVTYRESTKMYVVLMEAAQGADHQTSKTQRSNTTAYLRYECVKEAPHKSSTSRLKLTIGATIRSPYGKGKLVALRPEDNMCIVQTSFATMYLHEKDVVLDRVLTASDMNNQERMEAAMKKSATGNDLYQAGQLDEAVQHYLESLVFLNHVDQDSASHKEKAKVLQIMIRCHLNVGACKLKSHMYADAVTACSNALAILKVLEDNRSGKVAMWMGRLGLTEAQLFKEWPGKARFRRASALIAMDNDVDAKQDLVVAVKLMPKDKACRQLLESLQKRLIDAKEKEKQAWGGFLLNENTLSNVSPSKGSLVKMKTNAPPTTKVTRSTPSPWYHFDSSGVLVAAAAACLGVAAMAIAASSRKK
jgi:hypothetical protein